MASKRPQVLFVAGPRSGQRVVLVKDHALAGRLPTAELALPEQTASRKHMRFERRAEGWAVECLSPNGTFVNGKRYKPGKVILLETGDVVGAGQETLMLFVAAGDDPQQAMAVYQPPAGTQAAPGENHQPHAPQKPPADRNGGDAASPRPPRNPAGTAAATDDGDDPQQAARRRRKHLMYLAGFSVYALAIVALVVLLRGGGDDPVQRTVRHKTLADEEIREILAAPYSRRGGVTRARADQALREARAHFANRHHAPDGRYLAVRAFKEYLAGRGTFADPDDHHAYRTCLMELQDQVVGAYRRAITRQTGRQWQQASDEWRRLIRMLPEEDPDDPVNSRLLENVKEHWHLSVTEAQSEGRRRRR